MPAWLTKILVSLAPTVLDWLSSKIAEIAKKVSDEITTAVEEKKKDKRKKKRNELARKLEIAKENNDREEIKRLSIALHMLDSEL